LYWLVSDEAPDVLVERAEFLHRCQEHLGIPYGGVDLQPVTDDPGIRQQLLPLLLAVLGDDGGMEIVKGLPVVVPLVQDRGPTQSGLCPPRTKNSNNNRSS
jgi:hypothetical protein